jgi:hypothetical protein
MAWRNGPYYEVTCSLVQHKLHALSHLDLQVNGSLFPSSLH